MLSNTSKVNKQNFLVGLLIESQLTYADSSVKLQQLYLDPKLNWQNHVNSLVKKSIFHIPVKAYIKHCF